MFFSPFWMWGLVSVIKFGNFSSIITSDIPFILSLPSPASILVIFFMSSYVIPYSSGMFCFCVCLCVFIFCLLFSSFLSAFQRGKFKLTFRFADCFFRRILILKKESAGLLMSPWKALFLSVILISSISFWLLEFPSLYLYYSAVLAWFQLFPLEPLIYY